MTTTLGPDLASYQGAPDFDRMRKAGIQFIITKVTEGKSYTFPGFHRNRSEGHRTGMIVGMYHFGRADNATEEAQYFLNAIGPLASNEFVVLDWEVPSPDPVGWCSAWMQTVTGPVNHNPFIYHNKSSVAGYDWSPLKDNPLWLADYDGTLTMPTGLRTWGSPAIKQYSDAGTISGVNGKVDLNVFFGTVDQLQKLCSRGTHVDPLSGPDALPSLVYGLMGSAQVASLQRFLNAYPWKPPLPLIPVTGNYLDQTVNVLRAAQGQMGVISGDGKNVGPQTKRALWVRGWRG